MVEKLFPDTFQKTQNWAYLWIRSLKVYKVCLYCMLSWKLSKYIETKLYTACFYDGYFFNLDTYLSLLNSFLFLSRFSVSLKSLDNYFFRWFAYKSLLSRFSVLISYNMCSSNQFSISSRFSCFSRSRFFRVQVFRVRVQVIEVAFYII